MPKRLIRSVGAIPGDKTLPYTLMQRTKHDTIVFKYMHYFHLSNICSVYCHGSS